MNLVEAADDVVIGMDVIGASGADQYSREMNNEATGVYTRCTFLNELPRNKKLVRIKYCIF